MAERQPPVPASAAPVSWLSGIRVVEVTTGTAAPLAGRVLADLGADVIKVESRAKPDIHRARLPRSSDPDGYPAAEAFQLLHEVNSSKKSVTFNLKSDMGMMLFDSLLRSCDVFIENFAPGWLERLGSSFDELRRRYPELIMLSASVYGQEGPRRAQRGYAPVMSALAGIEGLVGYEDGEVVGILASALSDLNSSYYAAYLVLAALAERQQTGLGQYIDLSQIEASTALIGEAFAEQQLYGGQPGPAGNAGIDAQSWHVYPTAQDDEWVAAAATTPEQAALIAAASGGDRQAALDRLRREGIEAAPVLSPDEVDAGSLVTSRLQSVTHPDPQIGELHVTSLPWLLDGMVPLVRSAAPRLGEHTRDVCIDLGMTPEVYEAHSESEAFR